MYKEIKKKNARTFLAPNCSAKFKNDEKPCVFPVLSNSRHYTARAGADDDDAHFLQVLSSGASVTDLSAGELPRNRAQAIFVQELISPTTSLRPKR